MVTERVRTLPIEPTEGEIAKSNPLLSFINIGQRGRIHGNTLLGRYITLFVAMVCLLQLTLQNVSRSFINPRSPYWRGCFMHVVCTDIQTYLLATHRKSCLKFDVLRWCLSWAETVHKTPVLETLSSTN